MAKRWNTRFMHTDAIPSRGEDRTSARTGPSGASETAAHAAFVTVVGKSRVNTIVVSKIVERSGLRSEIESPTDALRALGRTTPILVILDGGAANGDCAALMPALARMRGDAQPPRPSVILLTTGNFDEIDPSFAGVIDAVVSKPILPEVLQPVVDRLVGAARLVT